MIYFTVVMDKCIKSKMLYNPYCGMRLTNILDFLICCVTRIVTKGWCSKMKDYISIVSDICTIVSTFEACGHSPASREIAGICRMMICTFPYIVCVILLVLVLAAIVIALVCFLLNVATSIYI